MLSIERYIEIYVVYDDSIILKQIYEGKARDLLDLFIYFYAFFR
jgi:hypothetical protein